ncbi:MAG TPA: DUF3040 domain-containing protein [Streptosporangiaceae bacterium]|nr:DUF3040 domain-containing protein [Streptosporangiaceae bacterium]
MALPMDEQRILEEMERMLAADDPRLAARLAAFGQPGIGQALRTRRGQAVLSLVLLAMIAVAALIIYLFSEFKLGTTGVPAVQRSSARPFDQLPAGQVVPVSGPVHCVVMIVPGTCTAWSASTAGSNGKAPAGAGLP